MLITSKGSSTLRTDSRASSAADLDNEETAIDRHRIDPNEARNNFLTRDPKGKATQGWIGSKRSGFRTASKRVPDGDINKHSIDSSDDEDDEGLERKIARLRREVSEVKEAFERRRPDDTDRDDTTKKEQTGPLETLDSLSRVLENIKQPKPDWDHPSDRLLKKLNGISQSNEEVLLPSAEAVDGEGYVNNAKDSINTDDAVHAMSQVSDFDKRLRLLETALGVESIPLPTQERSTTRAVLPVLDTLDRQVSAISVTDSSLDKISRQIRQMTQESEKLAEARKAAAAQLSSSDSSHHRNQVSTIKAGSRNIEDTEDLDLASKINALYGTLPTIESLSPMLPSVLDRLRSLRAIHADAALASEALTMVESRQAAMAEEIKEWKDGLGKVESAMHLGESSMKENMEAVDGWVKDLELRLQKMKAVNNA